MSNRLILFLAAVCTAAILSGCGSGSSENGQASNQKTEITVSAAASLQNALLDMKQDYEKGRNVKLLYNFGGSGALQQQIAHGAPVDVFVSAALEPFQHLADNGMIDTGDSRMLLGNELVLIVPKTSESGIASFHDLSEQAVQKIAIGAPESVPAGRYSKEALRELGIWTDIEKKLVLAKDVRQVLNYVETANVEAGIVYNTDALSSSSSRIVATVDSSLHKPIVYPLGIIKNSKHSGEARDFYHYLQSKKAADVFEQYGFTVLNEPYGS